MIGGEEVSPALCPLYTVFYSCNSLSGSIYTITV